MSLKTAYEHLEEDEIDFTSGMGWLAAIAFALALMLFAASFYFPVY
jgi:hypothetical protein